MKEKRKELKKMQTLKALIHYTYIYISTKFNQRIKNKIHKNKIKIYSKKKPVIDTGQFCYRFFALKQYIKQGGKNDERKKKK